MFYLRKLPRHPAREAVRAGYRGPVYGTGWTVAVALLAAFGIAVTATPAGISSAGSRTARARRPVIPGTARSAT